MKAGLLKLLRDGVLPFRRVFGNKTEWTARNSAGISGIAAGIIMGLGALCAPSAQTNPDIYFLPDNPPFTPYSSLPLLLGNGFTSGGGKVTVKLIGNDASNTGYLYFIDPATGQRRFLFMNKDAEGTTVDLGSFPKGAPIVFMFVADQTRLTPKKYTGANTPGTYNFDANPALAGLAVNHQPMPVSDELNDKNDRRWAVAGRFSCTDVVFGFEDIRGGDYDYNDIVFLVTGVNLDSEIKLPSPIITGSPVFRDSSTITLSMPAGSPPTTRIFYTLDGSAPTVSPLGAPQPPTLEYTSAIRFSQDLTLKAMAWNPNGEKDSCGSSVVYSSSEVSSVVFSKMPKLDPPTFDPVDGTAWTPGLAIALKQNQGAEIHFVVCDPKAACADPDSASPVYAVPVSLAHPALIKAKAYKSGSVASEIAHAAYGLNLAVASAVYLDLDGDGRIDAARIILGARPDTLPVSVALIDPFHAATSVVVNRDHLSFDPADEKILVALFPDRPFLFGTGFAEGPYGSFPSGPDAYSATPFAIGDAVGPVLVSAEAEPRSAGLPDRLRVTFSEDMHLETAGKAFSYSALHPGGREFAAGVVVIGVRDLGGRAFEYTLSAGTGPQPRDSLKALPQLSMTDLKGNQSRMGFYLLIGGRTPIAAQGGGFVVGGPIANPVPLVSSISVAVPSDPATRIPGTCLDCKTGEWKKDDPTRPDVFPKGPEIRISAKGAFHFDLRFYDHLGQFVNRASGRVSESMLKDLPVDSLGRKSVALLWYPVSSAGQQVGTGVYIVSGTATSEASSERGPQGEIIRISASESVIGLRLGYVR